MLACLVACLLGGLAGWLVGWLAVWLVGWLGGGCLLFVVRCLLLFVGAPAFERCAFTTSPFCGNSCLGVSGGGGGGGGY